jgi:alpha-D-ribose 1-methylphosphonate 5-triphosphate synthase subunit PhnG
MQRNSIRQLLVSMTDHEIDKLAAALPLDAVTVLRPPVTGLVMAKVQDCFQYRILPGRGPHHPGGGQI